MTDDSSLKIMTAALFGFLGVICMVVVTSEVAKDLRKKMQREAMVFEDMDKAREYQRDCLKNGGSAIVRSEVTGITIICEGKNQ